MRSGALCPTSITACTHCALLPTVSDCDIAQCTMRNYNQPSVKLSVLPKMFVASGATQEVVMENGKVPANVWCVCVENSFTGG